MEDIEEQSKMLVQKSLMNALWGEVILNVYDSWRKFVLNWSGGGDWIFFLGEKCGL